MSKIKKYFNSILTLCILILITSVVAPTICKQIEGNDVLAMSDNIYNNNGQQQVTSSEPINMPNLDELGPVISNDEYGINNSYFYQYLLEVFNSTYKDYPGFIQQTQLRYNTLSEIKEIRLRDVRLKDISGLRFLNMPKLEVLDLALNEIQSVNVDDLKYLDNLKELDLYHNEISVFEIPSRLTKLTKLNLNANNLTALDLSRMYQGEVYLSMNKITSVANIKLPTKTTTTNLYVELLNNNILDGDNLYLDNGISSNGGQINVELGLQGIGLNQKVTTDVDKILTSKVSRDNNIKYYNINKYNVKVVISDFETNEIIKTIENNDDQSINNFILPVGNYKLTYVNPETNETLFNFIDSNFGAFKASNKFIVTPKSPVVKFLVNGKEYDDYKKFTSWDAKVIARNSDDGGKVYYSIGNSDWAEGTDVKLNRGGQYIVAFKCVYENGIESEIVTKQVYMSLNPYIPDVFMIIIIGIVVLVLFFVLLPLIKKYVIKK